MSQDDEIQEHPAGCFYGSFLAAYPDAWHIPFDVDCPLDHGKNPIRLEAPELQEMLLAVYEKAVEEEEAQ